MIYKTGIEWYEILTSAGCKAILLPLYDKMGVVKYNAYTYLTELKYDYLLTFDIKPIDKTYPVWKQRKTGTPIRIKDMDDKHLLNSVAVCLRLDNRYVFDTERMQSFYFMTREVARRKLHKKLQEKMNAK